MLDAEVLWRICDHFSKDLENITECIYPSKYEDILPKNILGFTKK